MADKFFDSTAVTFVDMADSRILDVYIASNHPTIQLCNSNETPLEYTPDWSETNLKLEASFYLDSTSIIPETIEWYTRIGTAETTVGSTATLSVSTNVLKDSPIITYGCKITYDELNAFKEITFTRVDTGLNGTNGTDAPAVLAQYSADGTTNWTSTLNSTTHKYIRHSYDGGKTWSTAIKMVGEDGTSVKIVGTATSATKVSGTDYYTLVYSSASLTNAELGDSYLYDGDLYVCADSRDGQDYFINVGNIQGPSGNDGESSYVFIRYATDANGTNMSTSPSGKTYMGVYTSNTNVAPTTASLYTWSKFVGDNAKSIVLSGESQVFKVSQSNIVTPSTIKVTAQAFNTTITNWTYSTNGGQTFLSTVPTGVSRNGNIVTVTGSSITSNSLTIKASDGTIEDVFTIYKAFDGIDGNPGDPGDPAPIAFLTNENVTFSANAQGKITGTTITSNVVAYRGTTKVTPTIGTISGAPTGMTITQSTIAASNEVMLTITIANNSTLGSTSSNMGAISIPVTYPISTVLYLTWSKVNSGAMGVGIKSTTVAYGVSSSASTKPADTAWQSTIPTVAEGQYLWTRTIIDYTDDSIADTVTYTYAKQGTQGNAGSAGSSVTVSSIQYQEGASATVAPTGTWSNSVVAVADGKFLWTKTAFSDGKTAYGVARQGINGSNGTDGRGVSSIVEQYYQSTSATTQSGGSWSATVPTWADGKYIWTRSVITYTDSTTSTTSPVCVTGQKGGTGATGIGVSSVDVWYYQSTSATALSGGSWSTTAPTWSDGKYVWTKTITTYTNSTTDETAAVCITGQKGSTGVGIKSVTEYYLATSSSSGVTTSTTGWTTTIQTITADKKYLWNYEVITYTDNTTNTTSPIIIGAFGNTGSAGATGKGIKSVTEYYLASTLSTGITTSTTGWTTTIQSLTATNKYLWNYELITYTDNSTATINPVIIGVYGDKGDKGSQGDRGAGISSVTVTYGTSTSASTHPTSWQTTLPTVAEDSYLWTRTVTDYTDSSIADTVTLTYAKQGAKGSTGSAGTSVTVSSIQYQSGTSATTAPTGTWSNSVVTVAEGSYLWTKTTFSDGKVAYGVAKQGAKGSAGVNAVAFQIYAPNGYLLSNEVESLTLQTFAYDGNTAITSATYAWSYQENDEWVAISGATTSSLTLTKDDVIKSKTYRCAMTYKNITYYSTATVQDKSDIYDVMICVSDNINPLTGIYYWVVYALLYSEQGEADALLGSISINAPDSPTSGDYWYAVDTATQTVTLKKYNGSAWVSSTDKQAYAYDWRHIIDGTQQQAIGNTDKVQIISCNSFTSSATFQCIVTDTDGSKLARCNIHLTDTSDPIVSATAPVGVKDGQLWMQTQTDGTFLLYIWDADMSMWKQLNADTKNVVHTTKPSSYKTGDLWVVESDAAISGYTKGTLLQANATTTTFSAAHWTPSLKYEQELSDVQNALKAYKQYMTVDSDGLHMQAKNSDGTLSPFQALFTNTRLSFYQDDLEVAYISDNKLNIYEANIDVLSVEKKIQLQKFEWAIESNGSMSLIVNY